MKLFDAEGNEVEAFSAEDVTARESAAATAAAAAKEAEFTPKVSELEGKLTDTEKRLSERTGEFNIFRKLRDEDVAKLSAAEKTIYENGVALQQANEDRANAEKAAVELKVKEVIASKAGTNATLAEKMTEMWPLIGVVAVTADEIERKAAMVLGALSTQQPDLVATANGFNGGFRPPVDNGPKEGESFADTERGKAAATELGFKSGKTQK